MMKLSVLASSSRGNCTVITAGGTSILIDAGISATRIRKGLAECELTVPKIAGIFITHEHQDHVCGLGVLGKKDVLPLYCSRYLARDLRAAVPSATMTYMEPGAMVQVGALRVTPFCTCHDAMDPFGYVVEHEGLRVGYVTDTGKVKPEMLRLLEGVDALVLESNYDPGMLENSGRSPALIDRISGDWGHLSNQQSSDLVRTLAHPGLQHVVLAHLSPECNTPELAKSNMQRTLDELALSGCALHCAPMANRLPWVEIRASLSQ